jgi:hypothetical protein
MTAMTQWNPAALLLAVVVFGGVVGETTSFAQNNEPAVKQERDQRYLIYVKGIT